MAENTEGVDALLGTTVVKPLSASQTMVLALAATEQSRLKGEAAKIHARATEIEAQGDAVMNQAVLAVRQDYGVPVEVQVKFRDVDGAVVIQWDEKPAIALVKDAPAAEGAETT